jgi:hypothetical protein
MSDTDDAQTKAEIDGIMNGVKSIMKKIDALTPNKDPEAEQVEDKGDDPDSSDNNLTGAA